MDGYEYSGLIIGGLVLVLIVRLIIGYWASKRVQTKYEESARDRGSERERGESRY